MFKEIDPKIIQRIYDTVQGNPELHPVNPDDCVSCRIKKAFWDNNNNIKLTVRSLSVFAIDNGLSLSVILKEAIIFGFLLAVDYLEIMELEKLNDTKNNPNTLEPL